MTLDDHPNVFRFESRIWVSEAPREDALEQIRAQRAWDKQNAKLQRWWVALGLGAIIGVTAVLVFGTTSNIDPTLYLLALPVGFGGGAILGALVNKRFNAPDAQHASLPARPTTVPLTLVPSRVAKAAPEQASAKEIIEWSQRGFVG